LSTTLALTPDELLTTTRAVRKRLDFDREVPMSLVRECVEIALQAPTGSNAQGWHFVAVRDAAKRAAIAEIYRKNWAVYEQMPFAAHHVHEGDASMTEVQDRVVSSAEYLARNLHRVPVFLIPCVTGRVDTVPVPMANLAHASTYGSILPAAWSFMLAARARGLGTCFTTLHLMSEPECSEILAIPHDEITQCGLIPVAWYTGDSFRPAPRKPLDPIFHVDTW
jgi:nitroreductase